jgi:hypothetical protein
MEAKVQVAASSRGNVEPFLCLARASPHASLVLSRGGDTRPSAWCHPRYAARSNSPLRRACTSWPTRPFDTAGLRNFTAPSAPFLSFPDSVSTPAEN